MKQARYQFVKNKAKPHKISFYLENGKRTSKFFADKGEALLFQLQISKPEDGNIPDVMQFTLSERLVFAQIKAEYSRLGSDLDTALRFFRENFATFATNAGKKGMDWKAAVSEFLQDTEKRGARIPTIQFYKNKINLFQTREHIQNVKDATLQLAESYLAKYPSPEHSKRALRAFYNFCIQRGWIAENPFLNAKLPRILKEVKAPEILSVEETRRLFENIPADWRPATALMVFAGVRPLEIVSPDRSPVLKVCDIDFESKKIKIPAEISKTRRLRILSDLPANLWAWLEPLKTLDASLNIAPASYEVWRSVKEDSGVKIAHDALRHSFASYAYHFLGAEHTVEIMGHVGGFAVFAKHYKGLADKKSAKEYFSTLPRP